MLGLFIIVFMTRIRRKCGGGVYHVMNRAHMKNLLRTAPCLLLCLTSIAAAIETQVVCRVGNEVVTNVDVFKEQSMYSPDTYFGIAAMKENVRRMIEPLLLEQYALKHHFPVTDRQVMDRLKQQALERGYATVEDYFKRNRGKHDEGIEDWQSFKMSRKSILVRRVIEHFDPHILIATEEDIHKYVQHYKKRYSFPMGIPESIQFRCISVLTDGNDDADILLPELEAIKQRINNNEKFEDVVHDYRGRGEFLIQDYSSSMRTHTLESAQIYKQGADALVSWKNLKDKAVIVSFRDAGYSVWFVEDHTSDTRMEIEDAVNDKELRKEVIKRAKGLKFSNARRRFLEKQKVETVTFADDENIIYQKLADQYESWWIVTFKDTPDFQRRLENLKYSKEKFIERQRKKAKRQK